MAIIKTMQRRKLNEAKQKRAEKEAERVRAANLYAQELLRQDNALYTLLETAFKTKEITKGETALKAAQEKLKTKQSAFTPALVERTMRYLLGDESVAFVRAQALKLLAVAYELDPSLVTPEHAVQIAQMAMSPNPTKTDIDFPALATFTTILAVAPNKIPLEVVPAAFDVLDKPMAGFIAHENAYSIIGGMFAARKEIRSTELMSHLIKSIPGRDFMAQQVGYEVIIKLIEHFPKYLTPDSFTTLVHNAATDPNKYVRSYAVKAVETAMKLNPNLASIENTRYLMRQMTSLTLEQEFKNTAEQLYTTITTPREDLKIKRSALWQKPAFKL